MKQRCAILTCDYYSGGECQNLCSLKPQRIDTSQLQAPIRQVGGEVEQRATGGHVPEGDWLDLTWTWPALAVLVVLLCVLLCVLLGSVVAVFLRGAA